jgi:subtilisin family serine protease
MERATFYNKRMLCYTEDTDFTDYQGIGSDPMYRRYDSVFSVVRNNIDERYQSLLAGSYYEDGVISWYVDEWTDTPVCFTEQEGSEKVKYVQIKEETLLHYQQKMQQMNAEDFAILSGALKYINDEFIYCYDNKITLVAWGMRPDTSKHLVSGSWIKGLKIEEKCKITFDAGTHGKLAMPIGKVINRKKGYKLISKDIPDIVSDEGYSFAGWSPVALGYEVVEDCVIAALYNEEQRPPIQEETNPIIQEETVKVYFDANNRGTLDGVDSIECIKGHVLQPSEIPTVHANREFSFSRWSPNISQPILADTIFIAEYEQDQICYKFDAGNNGIIKGKSEFSKPLGTALKHEEIPIVTPSKGFRFTGWDTSPLGVLNSDKTFTAQYERTKPWYRRLWLWLTGSGCLKWLLWALLFILLVLLLSYLLRGCGGIDLHDRDRFGAPIFDDHTVVPIGKIHGEDGVERDNNGTIGSIIDDDGNLPQQGVVAPIIGDGGEEPIIIHNQGAPDVIGNRLNIYFDNEDADLNQWANDFKKVYPTDEYQIIGYDENVRMIQLQIPESQRNKIREEINAKIPNQEFFVVDESIMTLHGSVSKYQNDSDNGWHLKATNVKQAWNITRGTPEVIVAIVDDGIDFNHKMLQGRFYKAYNVFTRNRTLGIGEGHGTHVAGLAVGSEEYYDNGAAGVAPRCKIMPIQVFDNGICTFSSITSGIMYAIHNGADVINVSIAPSFQGLDQIPLSEQQKIAEGYFKNEERVYRHIIQTANRKNVILVFAAGNDNIMAAILPERRVVEKSVNVAAVTPDFTASDFTNYSVGTNISAPGVNIYSSYPNNSFKVFEGTSMAAPIVSGAIALMRSIKSDLTVEQAIGVLQQTGRNTDKYIPSMILIDKALEAVKNGNIPDSPISSISNETRDTVYPVDNSTDDNPDNYSALESMLEQLKAQRSAIDEQIKEIEQKLK